MRRPFKVLILTAVIGLAVPVLADAPRPVADFTFRMIKPPKKGAVRRITVQVDPVAQRARLAASAAAAVDPGDATSGTVPKPVVESAQAKPASAKPALKRAALSGLEWYWAGVSPKLADANAGRLASALAHLRNAPAGKSVPAPPLDLLRKIASAYGREILMATVGTQVSPALVVAVASVESSGRGNALSKAGAEGVMQLMPDTAKRFGATDTSAAGDNIKAGVAYLDFLMKQFKGDPVMVLAAYNAGENAIWKNAGVPPYPETRAYVPKVLAAWTVARALCLTPPDLLSDGCVFAVDERASHG